MCLICLYISKSTDLIIAYHMASRVESNNHMPPPVYVSELPFSTLHTKCGLGLNVVLAPVVYYLSNHKGHPSFNSVTKFGHGAKLLKVGMTEVGADNCRTRDRMW